MRGGARPGAGRPKGTAGGGGPRSHSIQLRLSDRELAEVCTLAEAMDVSKPTAIRSVISSAANQLAREQEATAPAPAPRRTLY